MDAKLSYFVYIIRSIYYLSLYLMYAQDYHHHKHIYYSSVRYSNSDPLLTRTPCTVDLLALISSNCETLRHTHKT